MGALDAATLGLVFVLVFLGGLVKWTAGFGYASSASGSYRASSRNGGVRG